MSRRRQFDEPVVHPYWVHSEPDADPERSQPHGDAADEERPHGDPGQDPPGETPCPGSCNRAWRAAEEAGEDHDEVMHPGHPIWCVDVPRYNHRGEPLPGLPAHRGCTERITDDLRELTSLAAHLTPGTLNTPRDVRADDRGMGSSGMVHPPTNSPAWDTADELIRWALSLEGMLRARLGDGVSSRQKWHTLSDAIRYLTAYAGPLLSGPDGERIGRQIMNRRRTLEGDTGTDRLIHRLPGLCLVCDRKGLQRPDGGELVKCRHCGATWDWDHYQQLSKAYADDVRRRGA